MGRRTTMVAGVLVVVLVAAACGGDDSGQAGEPGSASPATGVVVADVERAPADPAMAGAAAEGINEFAFDYYRVLAEAADDDIVFSPTSIAIAFAMAYAGARGETAAEIAEVFGFPAGDDEVHAAYNALDQALSDSGESILRLANRMYPRVDYELVADFVETLAAQYGSELERLDFVDDPDGSRARINEWVEERTEGLIPELLPDGFVDATTVLVLVNALYLEADWAQPFGKYPTEDADFTTLDDRAVTVAMMRNAELRSTYVDGDGDGFQAVELPYGDGELSMLVVVPAAGRFAEVEASFDAAQLAAIDAAMTDGVVDLALPQWSSSFDVDLVATLPELGLRAPFSAAADFRGISPANPFLGAGVHAAEIAVDEEGTVAAAATALGFDESLTLPDVTIRADRPFLYLIRDTDTGTILFQGRVLDPST